MACAGLALLLAACGGKNKGAEEAKNVGDGKVPKVDPTLCEVEGKRVTTFDLNRDDKPDVWKLFKQTKEGETDLEVLSCKQVDLDHDGRKDYVVGYNTKGGTTFEKFDFDFDGRFDALFVFDEKTSKVAEVQRDSDFDGRYDLLEAYDQTGVITSIKRDRNADGEPDLWEQYVKGELVAILYDEDYDSKVDRREEVKVKEQSSVPPPAATDETATDAEDAEDAADAEPRPDQAPAGAGQTPAQPQGSTPAKNAPAAGKKKP